LKKGIGVATPSLLEVDQGVAQWRRGSLDGEVEVRKARRDDSIVGVGVEQGGAQPKVGDPIHQLAGQANDEPVPPQPPQIVGGPARSI